MNYKVLMSIIAIIITILLAILLIWGTSSCDARSNPVYIEGGNHSGNQNLENSEESSSVHGIEDSIFDNLEEGQLIGDFEGSDKPAQSGSNGNTTAASSSSSSSEQSSGSSSSGSRPSNRPSSGSSSSAPSSGSSSSAPSSGSSSSQPTTSDAELNGKMTYEEYMALDGKAQEEYMKSFPDVASFFDWYNAAKDKYEKENPSIEIGGDPIDMGAIINGKNG